MGYWRKWRLGWLVLISTLPRVLAAWWRLMRVGAFSEVERDLGTVASGKRRGCWRWRRRRCLWFRLPRYGTRCCGYDGEHSPSRLGANVLFFRWSLTIIKYLRSITLTVLPSFVATLSSTIPASIPLSFPTTLSPTIIYGSVLVVSVI